MDPDATLETVFACIAMEDRTGALEALLDLQRWFESGGFCPGAMRRLSSETGKRAVHVLQIWIAQSAGAVGAELNLE